MLTTAMKIEKPSKPKWGFVVLHKSVENGGFGFEVQIPLFMIDLLVSSQECRDIFMSDQWSLDTEFDEDTPEQIKIHILERMNNLIQKGEDPVLFPKPEMEHGIIGVGNSTFDLFRINALMFVHSDLAMENFNLNQKGEK